ncbi:two-component system chemotaxis response regulator CheY [Actinoplanes lutulentus]|uniref:Two-component system chemotaxis response regulator CheY n=1 Tax=Actinoplanes lutulentus TaxID=1287878 RepID=A0A327Z7W9_9ACTN|nr:response regulator [Actinoplanes lutulentus]MBB2942356.1 two-component system chemotaxis response regulator CheY [Actinoplanes lutulentus]RAK33126.1 two-component system chemotaxis response regulator CheY [Actinoplanes lutulentus]
MTATETPPRVLIVDDAATVRMYHRTLLTGAGFEVDESVNGLEAVEVAMSASYDLFLVDVNMPKMNGYICVEALRSGAVGSDAPVVMISTEDRQRDADRAYAVGANLYLGKPVAGERLIRIATMLTAGRGTPE